MHKSSANALPVSFCPLWGFVFLPFCAPRISDWKESIKRSKILEYFRAASVLKLICILDLSRDAPGNGFPLKIKIWLWIRRRQIRLDTRNSRVFILYTFASVASKESAQIFTVQPLRSMHSIGSSTVLSPIVSPSSECLNLCTAKVPF